MIIAKIDNKYHWLNYTNKELINNYYFYNIESTITVVGDWDDWVPGVKNKSN